VSRTVPTSPIELAGTASRLDAPPVEVPGRLLEALGAECELLTDPEEVAPASRDWWPLALHWSLRGEVPRRAAAVARPRTTAEVAAILRLCDDAVVPVTVAGGRSGVCGGSVPVFGGIVLDTTALAGLVSVDDGSGVVEVLPGTFGPELERDLDAGHGLSVGHYPQSFELSTVGGWVAARGAGQFSTRHGKIEHMVVGLEAVLADGRVVRTGGAPAAAAGPDLTQLLVGSEGTLAVITRIWLRAHPVAPATDRAAYRFASFADGVEACRRVLRRGATPAVLRLYDGEESARGRGGSGDDCVLLVLDEGDATMVEATMRVVEEACAAAGSAPADPGLVDAWMEHRNDTSALQALTRKGYVVDTLEVAAPWSAIDGLVDATRAALLAVPHARAATCHLSHSYPDGACVYFTFAATPPPGEVESTYVALWDAGQGTALANGGNLSHHHGVGLNRDRFAAEALGSGHEVLVAVKAALDPRGILNPGKLGIPSPFGKAPWP
jgi:alkyldihydroxyacetonephosphate synthase